MADDCLLEHLRTPAKSENGHNVLPYSKKNSGKVHRRNCQIHKNEITTAYCEGCARSICHECIKENCEKSKGHKFYEFWELLKNKIPNILEKIECLDQNLQFWDEKHKQLKRNLYWLDVNYKTVVKKIDHYIKGLHKKVDQLQNKLFSCTKKEMEKIHDEIKSKILFTGKERKKLTRKILVRKDFLRDLDALHNPELLPEEVVNDFTFLTDETDPDEIKQLYLSTSELDDDFLCQFADITVSNTNINLDGSQVIDIDSEHIEGENVQDIACNTKNETAYVSVKETRKILEFNKEGNVVNEYKTNGYPQYIAATPDGEGLVYGDFEKKSVRLINTSKTPYNEVSLFNDENWFPRGIGLTKSGHYLLCLKSWDNKRGKVFVVDSLGKEVSTIEYDDDGKPLYVEPRYVVQNKVSGDICVTDTMRKTMIAVESSGKYRYSYSRSYPGREEFNPLNICADSEGCTLLLDTGQLSTIIHVISNDGKILRFVMSDHFRSLTTMDIGINDRLWIANRENDKTKIKLIKQLK